MNWFKSMNTFGRLFVAILAVGLVYGGYTLADKYWPKSVKKSSIIAVGTSDYNSLPPLKYDVNSKSPFHQLFDSNSQAEISGGVQMIRAEVMEWNAQMGFIAANGGAFTMNNSLMAEQGVKLHIITQNDCGQQGKDLYAFIQDYAGGNKNSTKGCQMIAWMGDGCPSYLAGLNAQIKNQKGLGPEYEAQVFYACGSSFGEDKFIFDDNGRTSVKSDPIASLKGSLIAGVLRDGDWDIAMKYADINQIPVNNDPKTFDPDAINWFGTDDYMKAAQAYVAHTKDKREIVKNGKRTGRDTTIEINGVVTWFPEDKVALQQRGGVTVESTKDFSSQMPCVFLASKKWLEENREYVKKFILASAFGGDQVKSSGTWLTAASSASNAVYGDKDMNVQDWYNGYLGNLQLKDNQGHVNTIGGSRVFGLNDDAEFFGFSGGADKYSAVYNSFSALDLIAYPELFKTDKILPYDEVVDLSYMMEVWSKNKSNSTMTAASVPTFKQGETMSTQVAAGNYAIEFDVNSDQIRPSSYAVLDKIGNDLIIADNMLVSIKGHTDNTGNADANRDLSARRAAAVQTYLQNKFPKAFNNKITTSGVGQDEPLPGVSQNTSVGKQKNRRVEVIFGRQ